MNLTFRQSAPATGSHIDKAAGILRGVSVITSGEAKTHGVWIDGGTLADVQKAMAAFGAGGVKVKADHWTGFDKIVGTLRAAKVEGDRVRGDIHLLRAHPLRGQILELAEAQPRSFGLSIAFSGTVEERDGRRYARVIELYSVDLVDEPAANPGGLFSARPARGERLPIAELRRLARVIFGRLPAELEQMTEGQQRDILHVRFWQAGLESRIPEVAARTTELGRNHWRPVRTSETAKSALRRNVEVVELFFQKRK